MMTTIVWFSSTHLYQVQYTLYSYYTLNDEGNESQSFIVHCRNSLFYTNNFVTSNHVWLLVTQIVILVQNTPHENSLLVSSSNT